MKGIPTCSAAYTEPPHQMNTLVLNAHECGSSASGLFLRWSLFNYWLANEMANRQNKEITN